LSYLLDTNVVSESVKLRPDRNVLRWLAEVKEDRVCLSVITFAEIRRGIEEMSPGPRHDALKSWVENDLALRFDGRILGVGLAVAQSWGVLVARSSKMGLNLGVMDAFFAATAGVHRLTLVTRNTKHFEGLEISLENPWRGKL